MIISNPHSTGAGGADFERRIATLLTCQALAGMTSIPLTGSASSIWLQCGHLGSGIDDILVETAEPEGAGGKTRCYWSIKTTVSLTVSDPEFHEFCERAWQLFHDAERFNAERDRIALGVSSSRSPKVRRLIELCELSRSCNSSHDFLNRLSIRKYHSVELRELYGTVKQLTVVGDGEPEAEQLFAFLQRLQPASFDLDQEASQDKQRTIVMLSLAASGEKAAATSCWNALFEFVSEGAGKARHITNDDLRRLGTLQGIKNSIDHLRAKRLAALQQHCEITRGQIETRLHVTGLHLERHSLIEEIQRSLHDSRVVLVRGAAGSGKSAAALQAGVEIAGATQVYCFRAEEFLHPHLDAALQSAGLRDVGWQEWNAMLPQPTAVLLVDGVERLLQSDGSREAFCDLIRAVMKEPRWRILLTCRESLAETLNYELLELGAQPATVRVPVLSEEELDHAITGTQLGRIVEAHTALRQCVKNLKWLDLSLLALQGQEDDQPVTWSTESAWRKHLWHRLVLEKDGARRERCLLHVASSRLNSTSAWVEVAESLVDTAEDLVIAGLLKKSGACFTTAHDLIEDWSLLTHLDNVALKSGGSLVSIIQKVGDTPLMRNSFRHWLGEKLDDALTDALPWLRAGLVLNDECERWREETLLSLLGSRNASVIMHLTRAYWVAENGQLFKELIRCLQVAYIAKQTDAKPPQPRGFGWNAVLDFIADEGRPWVAAHLTLIVKMLMLWKSAVRIHSPAPLGFKPAGKIILMIWEEVIDHNLSFANLIDGSNKNIHDKDESFPELICNLAPALPPSFFEALLATYGNADESRWQHTNLAGQILTCVSGTHLSYALSLSQPQLVMRIFRVRWGLTPSSRTERRNLFSQDRGLLDDGESDFRRSSALVGPFLTLLRHHRELGVSFILELLNFSIQEERACGCMDGIDDLEVFEFEMEGHSFNQWGHQGWWRTYRGGSAQHYLEESATMALEKWLLEELSAEDTLEAVCLELMQSCQNLAVTGVIASVATALSRKFVKFPLLVLQQPGLISLDRHRYINDQTNSMARDLDDSPQELKKERQEADQLPHRGLQLEHYIIDAQFGPACEGIQTSLTAWSEALAKLDTSGLTPKKADDLGVLRLLMHRMDMRNLSAKPMNDGTGRMALMVTQFPPDLEALINESSKSFLDYSKRQSAFLWASQMFDEHRPPDRNRWQEMLALAQQVVLTDSTERFMFGSLPAQVAAACVTFFWDALTAEDLAWCCKQLSEYLVDDEPLTSWSGQNMPVMRGMDFGHVAHGLGIACARLEKEHPLRRACLESCATALSHPDKNIAESVATGLGSANKSEEAAIIQLAAAALMFDHARTEHEVNYIFRGPKSPPDVNWEERRLVMHEELLKRVRILRRNFTDKKKVNEKRIGRLFTNGFTGNQRLASSLQLLLYQKNEISRRIFERAAQWLFCSWAEVRPRRRRLLDDELHLRGNDARNAVTIGAVSRVLMRRAMLQPEEGVHLMKRLIWKLRIVHLRVNARSVLNDLVLAADSVGDPANFWTLWRQWRDATRLVTHLIFDQAMRQQLGLSEGAAVEAFDALLSSLFFNKMNFRENDSWKPIEGHEIEVQEAFMMLGPIALTHFIRFLGVLGSPLLPEAWERIAESIDRLQKMPSLSVVIRPPCHDTILKLIHNEIILNRIQTTNRRSWNFIQSVLDYLSDQGSAEAFHLRETMTKLRLCE